MKPTLNPVRKSHTITTDDKVLETVAAAKRIVQTERDTAIFRTRLLAVLTDEFPLLSSAALENLADKAINATSVKVDAGGRRND